MTSTEFWLSQAGFAIVAAAFGWWAWKLWLALNDERAARELRIKSLEDRYEAKVSDLTSKLLNWADVVRAALDQNTEALRGLRDGLCLDETLDELRQSGVGKRRTGG